MTSGGLAAVSSSFFAALYSAFGRYDVVHIHAEGPAFFAWLPKMFGKRVVVTVHGIDWQREKWQSGLGSKFIHQGEKNAAKYADEVIVLSKGVANSDQGLCMLFDLEEAIMFTPKPQEYTDPLTGEMKKKQMKFFPDAYKNRIGKSYNDYIADHQMNMFGSKWSGGRKRPSV